MIRQREARRDEFFTRYEMRQAHGEHPWRLQAAPRACVCVGKEDARVRDRRVVVEPNLSRTHEKTSGTGQGARKPGREALLKYVFRPAVAQERVIRGPDGLVRITLKKPFSDGTVAVDLAPLSLLSRLAASVPAPRLHTVRYAGVLASASKVRARLAPRPAVAPKDTADVSERPGRGAYRSWAELLKRTFGFEVLTCRCCGGRMRLVGLVTEPKSVARYLRGIGEPTDVPKRTPARGPPYWASRVLRRSAGSVEAAE
jgi:hypothetical protein